jgi:hypothetical protein
MSKASLKTDAKAPVTHYYDPKSRNIKAVSEKPAVRSSPKPVKKTAKLARHNKTIVHPLDSGYLIRHQHGKDGGTQHGKLVGSLDDVHDDLEEKLRKPSV